MNRMEFRAAVVKRNGELSVCFKDDIGDTQLFPSNLGDLHLMRTSNRRPLSSEFIMPLDETDIIKMLGLSAGDEVRITVQRLDPQYISE